MRAMSGFDTTDLLSGLPETLTAERFETLLRKPGVRVERILSQGQSTPAGDWYNQTWDEWVLVLQGAARLTVEGAEQPISLAPGQAIWLPAHCRHRVDWTPPDQVTVWLALHFDPVGLSIPSGDAT